MEVKKYFPRIIFLTICLTFLLFNTASAAVNPFIAGLAPASTIENTGLTLTVNGTDFEPDSVINFNGIDKFTSYISSTQLSAQISNSDVATAGQYNVIVRNQGICDTVDNTVNIEQNMSFSQKIAYFLKSSLNLDSYVYAATNACVSNSVPFTVIATTSPHGTLTIVKNTKNRNETFDFFVFPTPTVVSVTTSGSGFLGFGNNTGSTSASLDAGFYDISESVLPYWTPGSVSCLYENGGTISGTVISGALTIDNVEISEGEDTICTFNNDFTATNGQLVITKNSVGGNGIFSFNATGPNGYSTNFSITTSGYSSSNGIDGTGSYTLNNLLTGTYTVTENTPPTNWTTTSNGCDITEVYANFEPQGCLIVNTYAVPPIFGCTDPIALNYNPGATQDDGSCTYEPPPTKGVFTIYKTSNGGDGTFGFTINGSNFGPMSINVVTSGGSGSTSINLPGGAFPGEYQYNIIENLTPGWIQNSGGFSCTTGGSGLNPSFYIIAGSTASCSIANFKLGSLTVTKHSIGGDGTFNFTFGTSSTTGGTYPPVNFSITTSGGTGSYTIDNVLYNYTGLFHSLSEFSQTGWSQTSASCNNGTFLQPIIDSGEVTSCIIENTKTTAVLGCTDPAASNYNPNATQDDGSCTYTTTLKIVKNIWATDAPAGTHIFNFNVIGPTPISTGISITPPTLTGSTQVFTIAPGTYDINEITPNTSGGSWISHDTVCNDDSGNFIGDISVQDIVIDTGENIVCTFTNEFTPAELGCTDPDATNYNPSATQDDGSCTYGPPPTQGLIIKKNSTGGNGTFNFSVFPTPTMTSITTSGAPLGFGETELIPLTPGAYNISETLQAGWSLTSISCDHGGTTDSVNGTAIFNIVSNETTTCTFNNTQATSGSIKIIKNTIGGNGSFSFTNNFGLSALNTVGGTASQTVNNLVPGNSYYISENIPAGWTQTSATCNNGTPSAINVVAGQTTTCTFTNTYTLSPPGLKLSKIVVGGSAIPSNWALTATGSPGGFSDSGNSSTFHIVAAGVTYSLSESSVANYTSGSWVCTGGAPAVGNTITLSSGQNVTCTITNTYNASITVTKTVTGGNGTFDFVASGPAFGPMGFSITTSGGTGSYSFQPTNTGTYTITETTPPAGWTQGTSTCSSVQFTGSQNVNCTISNSYAPPTSGSIKIIKNTIGGNGSFSFTNNFGLSALNTVGGTASQTVNNLVPGNSYYISENIPAGWTQTGATCNNGTPSAINVVGGQTTTCTFTNTYNASITVTKTTTGGNGTFDFVASGPAFGPMGFSITTSGGSGTYSFQPTNTGTYTITETTPPAGWTQGTSTCGSVSFTAGQNSNCTIANSYVTPTYGSIKIIKNTTGGNGTFGFTTSIPGFSYITTSGGSGSQTINNVLVGTYPIYENYYQGWTLTYTNCDNGSSTGSSGWGSWNVKVTANTTTTCTFANNSPNGTGFIKIIKNTTGGDGTFNFNLSFINHPLSLTTVGGTTPNPIIVSVPTTTYYSITEATDPEWIPGNATCDNGNNPNAVAVTNPGQTVTCTFNNAKSNKGSIKIVKNASGGSGSTNFTFGLSGNFGSSSHLVATSGTSSNETGYTTINNLDAASNYSILENLTLSPGWTQTSATCNNGTPSAINVVGGQTTTCTFTNTYSSPPTLKLAKIAVGGPATPGDWTLTATGSPGGFIDTGSSSTFHTVAAGVTYTLSESSIADYASGSWVCTGGASAVGNTITLNNGQNSTCTITNVYSPPKLKLSKVVVGGSATSNDWVLTAAGPGGFSDSGSSSAFHTVTAGMTYNLSESSSIADYASGSWVCTGGASAIGDTITLDPGQNVTCTITNTYTPPQGIKIIKKTTGGNETFTYNIFPTPTQLNVTTTNGIGTSSLVSLGSGSYTITEQIPTDWTSGAVTCDHAFGYSADETSVTVTTTVTSGQITTCTFNNAHTAPSGYLKIIKNTVGGDDDFDYTVEGPTQLNTTITTTNGSGDNGSLGEAVDVGTYKITEELTGGWMANSISCSNMDGSVGTVDLNNMEVTNVPVLDGDTTTCTFVNDEPEGLIIIKNAPGAVNGQTFDYDIVPTPYVPVLPVTTTVIVTDETGTSGIVPLNPGDYTVDEQLPDEWEIDSVSCSDGFSYDSVSGQLTVTISNGTANICTFNNKLKPLPPPRGSNKNIHGELSTPSPHLGD